MFRNTESTESNVKKTAVFLLLLMSFLFLSAIPSVARNAVDEDSSGLEANLETQSDALNKREADVKANEDSLAKLEAGLKAQTDALNKREADAKAKEDSLTKLEADLKAKGDALNKREADAKAKEDSLAKLEAGLKAQGDAMNRREADAKARSDLMDKNEADLIAREEALNKRIAEFNRQEDVRRLEAAKARQVEQNKQETELKEQRNRSAAAALVRSGDLLAKDRNYAEALKKYEQAYRITPTEEIKVRCDNARHHMRNN